MPFKDIERKKEHNKKYGAKWYQRNKARVAKRIQANKKRHREKWQDFKSTLSCAHCGFSHPAVIDFHHTDGVGETKVSYYVQQGQWKKAYQEVEKCIPLCANCHRIHHWKELR